MNAKPDPTPAEALASIRQRYESVFTMNEYEDMLFATLARAVEGAEGDDNNLPEPFPRVHSYDPSGARRTVTVQWGEDSFVSYVRYGDRSTWKEIPPINETPVERPAPSAGVGRPVAWSRAEPIFDDKGVPIGSDVPEVRWQAEYPDPDEDWWPLYRDAPPASAAGEAEVLAMVDRFLAWRFPEDFAPDGGISYTPLPRLPEWTHDTRPTGTNLLTAIQARAMLEYVLAAQGGSDK